MAPCKHHDSYSFRLSNTNKISEQAFVTSDYEENSLASFILGFEPLDEVIQLGLLDYKVVQQGRMASASVHLPILLSCHIIKQ